MKKLILLLCLATPAICAAQPGSPVPPPGPPPEGIRLRRSWGGTPLDGPMGIPPHVAAKLGIPAETVKKVKDMAYEANVQLIGLEADVKRAQLELDRALSADSPDEGAVMSRVDAVGRAELGVRKNRLGLMLRVRKLLGPQLWQRLQAELPPTDHNVFFFHGPGGPGGPGEHRRIEIIRREDAPPPLPPEAH